ncbi:MAG: hypothetical protein IPI95_02920 [Flavobacteriales bacterium]|nr:hypothetical protein [Flavobacteriales bacterium]
METLGSADPGTNGTATLCSNGAAVQLIDSLNGTPDAGGTWSGPAAHPGTFDPATDAPGAFTYTVGLSSATVTVTVHGLPSAGTAGTLISCINGPAVDLFTRLGDSPDVGGAWTLAGNPVSNMFTPGTSSFRHLHVHGDGHTSLPERLCQRGGHGDPACQCRYSRQLEHL